MSSRVLRKLQGDKELEISHGDDEDEDELNFTSVKSKKKQKAVVNPFDLVSTNYLHTYTVLARNPHVSLCRKFNFFLPL